MHVSTAADVVEHELSPEIIIHQVVDTGVSGEMRLREKSFSRNVEQVRSPSLISLLLDARAYERTHLI